MIPSATLAPGRPIQPGLISVIIPTFRRYDDLRRAAESSVAQTHPEAGANGSPFSTTTTPCSRTASPASSQTSTRHSPTACLPAA